MFGTFFLGALYVQKVLGYDPIEIGFAFLPVSVLMGLISVRYSERLIGRFGARRLAAAGMVLIAIALGLLATTPTHGDYWLHLFPALSLIGLGAGTGLPAADGPGHVGRDARGRRAWRPAWSTRPGRSAARSGWRCSRR